MGNLSFLEHMDMEFGIKKRRVKQDGPYIVGGYKR